MSTEQNDPHKKEDLVITPGGPRPKDRVHLIPPGSAVSFDQEDKMVILPLPESTQTSNERIANMNNDLVLTPGGYRPRSQVHLVKPGRAINLEDPQMGLLRLSTGSIGNIPKASGQPRPPGPSNWISYAGWFNTSGNPITSFHTSWRVPPAPSVQGSQLIYIFNGIEPADGSIILQPVLQWGDSGKDEDGVQRTGAFWTVASWVVGSGGDAHHTAHVRVNPGDLLVGIITQTGHSGGKFSYNCEFHGIAGTSVPLTNSSELVWCSEALEAYENKGTAIPPYDLNEAAEYPAIDRVVFESINIVAISRLTGTVNPAVTWTPNTPVSNFGENTRVVSNSSTSGEVDIFFRSVNFQKRPAVFPTNAAANKKSIYMVTADGRLAQVWDTNHWNLDFPAELAGQKGLRFQRSPAVFPTNAAANKKSIYVVTTDGRLAQVWDTNHWNLDFPAESAGQAGLRFQGGPAVFPTNAAANKKSIYLLTTDGRLAQVWDTNHWNLDFPAESAGQAGLRFQGSPAVFPTNAAGNKKSIYLITTDGRLAQVWDTNRWNLDFPAESAGQAGLRFQGSPAVFPTDAAGNKKSIYLITTDGRLAQVWDTNRWNLDFPAESAGQAGLRFQGSPAVFPTNAAANKKSIYLVTTDGRLAQVWDTNRWNLDFPAESAGQRVLRFQGNPAVFPTNAAANKKSIYLLTTDGRLAQVWDTDHWNLDFPVEEV